MKKFLVTSLMAFMSLCVFGADVTLTVNNTKYQYIKGFGAFVCSPGFQYGHMSDNEIRQVWGPNSTLKCNIMRLYIPIGENSFSQSLSTARLAKSLGAIVFASPWSMPADMKTYNTINANANGNENKLKTSSYGAYANYLNNYVSYLKNNGVNLDAISIQNEPDWKCDYAGCIFSTSEMVNFLANHANKINCKVIAPETIGMSDNYANALYNSSAALANFEIYGGHQYAGIGNSFKNLANKGKELWMTEYLMNWTEGNQGENRNFDYSKDGMSFATAINNCMINNVNAWIHYAAKRFYALMGDGQRGTTSGQITKRGYIMGNFSKYLAGSTRIGSSFSNNNLSGSAYLSQTGDTVFAIVINSSNNTHNLKVSLPFTTRAGKQVVTSQSKNLQEQNLSFSGGTSQPSVTIEPASISTLIFVVGATIKDEIVAGEKGEMTLAACPFNSWNGAGANASSTGSIANNYNSGELNSGSLVYGDNEVSNLKYADLTGSKKLTVYGTDGLEIRALFNRQTASGSDYVEKTGTISEGKLVINLNEVSSSYVHLNAIKTSWGSPSGSISAIFVDKQSPIDYYLAGKGTLSSSAIKAISDPTAMNIDATGLTNESQIMLNVVNKNCLIYVDNASRLTNSQNVIVKNGNNYSCSNLVLADFASAYDERATAWLGGGSVTGSNANWSEAGNGAYTFSWNGNNSSVEIFHNLTGKEAFNKLHIETTEFTGPWGVRFYDSDGQEITSQGYWAEQTADNLIKVIDIDELFENNGVTAKRNTIKTVSIYNINTNSGKVTIKDMYLTKEIKDAQAWLGGGSVSGNNATWAEASNGAYAFTWSSSTTNTVEIFHNILGKTQYNKLVIETSEFTAPWGVRFYDANGTLIAEQGYWNGQNADNLIKEINIDMLFAEKNVSNMRESLKTICLYNISESGRVVVNNMYLTAGKSDTYYPFYAPYNFTASNATCYLTIDTFSPAWVPFNAGLPSGFEAYEMSNSDGSTNINKTTSLAANKPVLFSGKGVAAVSGNNVTVNATNNITNGNFIGVYDKTKPEAGSHAFTKIDNVDGVAFNEVADNDGVYVYPLHAYISKNTSSSTIKSIGRLIAGEDPNAIDNATTNNVSADGTYYNPAGIEISTPQQGINIVKMSDGSTMKVLIK